MYEPRYVPDISHTLLSTDGIRFGISHFKGTRSPNDPQADPLHIHDCVEVFFHLSGKVSFLIEDHLYPVSLGNAVLTRPNEIHMCLFESSQEYEHYCLWIDAPSIDIPNLLEIEKKEQLLAFEQKSWESLLQLLSELARDTSEKDSDLSRTAILLQILLILQKKEAPQNTEEILPKDLKAVLEDIDRNYLTISSIEELAKAHFISPATLNRRFRKYLQISPHSYMESKKLAHARACLADGIGVMDACFFSGFSDCSHFIKLFKKKFGETPLQYKKRC